MDGFEKAGEDDALIDGYCLFLLLLAPPGQDQFDCL